MIYNVTAKHNYWVCQFIFILMFFVMPCSAQISSKIYIKNLNDLDNWVVGNYHPDTSKINNICQESCVFIRFKILKNGKIGDLSFNKTTPDFIINALSEVFTRMSNEEIISDKLWSGDKTYLLPFIYNYQSACKTTYDPKKFVFVKKDLNNNIVDEKLIGDVILNMLNFNDKSFNSLDCIILPPITTGSAMN